MTPRAQRRSGIIRLAVCLTALSGIPGASGAQELPLLTTYPGSEAFACAPWVAPERATSEAAREARSLASEANEALVLGDMDRAQSFLERALELDGGSPELLYQHARLLEARDARAEAIEGFCRALAAGSGAETSSDAQTRLDSLVALERPTLSPNAVAAFDRGVSMARMGRAAAAEAAFDTAIQAEPSWPPPVYNSAVVSAQRGDRLKAVERLRSYLALAPDAPDAVEVSRTIGRWEAESSPASTDARLPDPGATLALGMFLPGTGQFYTGRPWPGVGVLAVASGAIAAGLLVREVTVRCVGTSQEGSCPPDQVVGRQTRRPHMGLALAVAAGATAVGALEAFFRVRSIRGRPPAVVASAAGGDVILFSMSVP